MIEVIIPNQDTRLFTTLYPNPGKETVILLHGGPGVPNGLTFIIQLLQPAFQVIHFHQRGTLKSPCLNQDYALAAYISDLEALVQYFKIEQFHLLGHSWGGLYAQAYAQQHPHRLRSLFLACAGPGTGPAWKDALLEVTRYVKNRSSLPVWLTLNFYSFLGLLGSNRAYQKFYQRVLHLFNHGFRVEYAELFRLDCIQARAINRTNKNILLTPPLRPLPQPGFTITVAYGSHDIFGESKNYVYQRYPTATLVEIPESGHVPWSHNPAAFTRVLNTHYHLDKESLTP